MITQAVKPILTVLIFLLATLLSTAQDKNPFQSIGKKGKIVTLTNGKYEELFDQDSIQQIGTVLVNVRQMKVVKLLKDKEAHRLLDNATSSRFLSVDPLTRNFAWNSPYAYAENTPIKFIDLDGAEKYDPSSKPTGVTHVQLATVPMSPQDARTDYSIKAGPYRLYPVSDPSGKRNSYWLARYTFTEGPYAGMHRDDWIVGTDGVIDFVKNGGKYYNKAGWIETLGGANQKFDLSSILKGYRKSWNPQNVAAGLMIGLGGAISIGSLSSTRFTASTSSTTSASAALADWSELEQMAIMSDNPLSVATSTNGQVFRAVVQNIEAEYGGNVWNLISNLNKEATSAGASAIEIKGIEIVNSDLNRIFQKANGKTLMGYEVKYSRNGSYGEVLLKKELPKK